MGVPRDRGDLQPGELAGHGEWEIRLEAALDPGVPPEALARLSRDDHEYVREGAAANPSAPGSVLAGLAADASPGVRACVAKNPTAGPPLLVTLSGDVDAAVRAAVAGNASTPPGVLGRLAEDPDAGVREQAAGNPSSPVSALAGLAADDRWEVRLRAAGDTSTPANVLARLAGDRRWEVRHAAAGNPGCLPGTLTLLAGDRSWKVRQRVAAALAYRHLAGREVPGPATVELLAGDEQWQVRHQIAQYPGAPPQALAALAEDVNERIRQAVAANRGAPPGALAGLAADDSLLVRAKAARNPETPPGALAGLLGESMPGIRSAAVTGLGRHVLGSVLEESVPGGLAVARKPLVQRPAGTAFAVPLVPDLAVAAADARLPACRVLDPVSVRLAVVIVSPGYGSAGDPAALVPYAEAGIAHVWRVEVDGDPVICVFRLDQGTCQLVTSARPGQLLAVAAPFPVTVDLAGLRQRLERWLTPAGERAGPAPAPDGTGGSGSMRAGTLARQAKAGSAAARQEAAGNRDTPPGVLAELAGDANWHVRRKAACNANTPPGALDELACDPQWHVRLAAAGNPHTPQGRLAALVGDERWEVRRVTAARRPAPTVLLDSLAHDPRREVRCAVASQPASPQALQALAADPFRQVRREVAANPSTPPEVLAQLAADDTEGAPASDDPYLTGTSRLQVALSEQVKETVRQRVARNPSSPADVLTRLAGDGAPRVRTYATAQLIWRNFMTILGKSAPRGLVLVRRPLIQRDERSVFTPDAAVVGEADVPASRTDRLDPAAVRLAVTIAWPWSRASPAAAPDPRRMAGIGYLWQIEPEDGPVISVHHLTGSAYLQIASARPGQPLTLDVPFPIRVDPADLLPSAPNHSA